MDKLFSIALRIFIVLSSVAYMPGTKNDDTQGMVFRVGIPMLFALSLWLKPKRIIVNRWINTILCVAVIFSMIPKGMAQVAAIDAFINIFLGVLFFYMVANHAKIDDITAAFAWAVCIHAGMVALQALGADPICIKQGGFKTDMTGLFQYRYAMGVYMGTITAYMLMLKKWPWAVLSAILTICSGSFAAIAIMAISAVIIFRKSKICLAFTAAAILFAVLLAIYRPIEATRLYDLKLKPRILIHNTFAPVILQNHLGYGMGSFKHIGPMVANDHNWTMGYFTDAWSDIVERSVEFGVWITFLIILLCYDAIRRGGAILLGIPLNMAFHSCLNHFNVSVAFLAVFAVWEILHYE